VQAGVVPLCHSAVSFCQREGCVRCAKVLCIVRRDAVRRRHAVSAAVGRRYLIDRTTGMPPRLTAAEVIGGGRHDHDLCRMIRSRLRLVTFRHSFDSGDVTSSFEALFKSRTDFRLASRSGQWNAGQAGAFQDRCLDFEVMCMPLEVVTRRPILPVRLTNLVDLDNRRSPPSARGRRLTRQALVGLGLGHLRISFYVD
jgi:hypothetical protein